MKVTGEKGEKARKEEEKESNLTRKKKEDHPGMFLGKRKSRTEDKDKGEAANARQSAEKLHED